MSEFPKWLLALAGLSLIPLLACPLFLFGAQPFGTSQYGIVRFLLYLLTFQHIPGTLYRALLSPRAIAFFTRANPTWLYKLAFRYGELGLAASLSIVMFVILFCCTVVYAILAMRNERTPA